jgi:hypothetical protein
MLQDIEVLAGALLVAAVLLDVYLTVLYARAGISVFSRFVCTRIWKLLRVLARRFGRRAGVVLSLAGPAVVVSLVLLWALLLTTGAALMFHPFLGSAIRKSGGSTPTDFISALYVAGNSMSIVGSSGYEPATAAFRLLFLFNSLMGMSVISLTLTYVMQIYGALQTRNAVGLRLFLMSGMTTRSAEMLARIAPRSFRSGLQHSLGTRRRAGQSEREPSFLSGTALFPFCRTVLFGFLHYEQRAGLRFADRKRA